MSPGEFKQIMGSICLNVALCFSAALLHHEKTVENRGFLGQNEGATVENESCNPCGCTPTTRRSKTRGTHPARRTRGVFGSTSATERIGTTCSISPSIANAMGRRRSSPTITVTCMLTPSAATTRCTCPVRAPTWPRSSRWPATRKVRRRPSASMRFAPAPLGRWRRRRVGRRRWSRAGTGGVLGTLGE